MGQGDNTGQRAQSLRAIDRAYHCELLTARLRSAKPPLAEGEGRDMAVRLGAPATRSKSSAEIDMD